MTPLTGSATAFFLFEVGEAIALTEVPARIADTVPRPLAMKPATPPYVQYTTPPVVIDGTAAGAGDVRGFKVRFKLFDYGVISVALTRPLPATWEAFLPETLQWYEDASLPAAAEGLCRSLLGRLQGTVRTRRETFLLEDYWVFSVESGSETPESVLALHGSEIAQVLRAERTPLSLQEREEVLRHRLSYYANDLVIPTWNGAFAYDTRAGAEAAMEILEFANSQLLEFRYYDQLLEAELGRIYSRLNRPDWRHTWLGRRHARAARQVHALFIDVNALTDKTENALKIAGDVYASRLFALVAARLGLDQWKGNVQEKLKTLDDIYRFAVEQTSMARGEVLELTIVAILILELVLFFLGIMR